MTTTSTEPTHAIITPAQVRTINAARTALGAIVETNHMDFDTQASGMIVALADTADAALFQLLNWYASHAHGELTEAQLHNRPAA
jgi:hypothetical protein